MIKVCAEAVPGESRRWLEHYQGKKPLFACVLSFTETALLPNISAAGQTSQDRLATAATDGSYLLKGTPLVSLSSGVSPAVITRAILRGQTIHCQLVSTGLPTALSVPHLSLPRTLAKSVQTGQAMSIAEVSQLFYSAQALGHQLARQLANHCQDSYLIVGECVVGGTTTAQAILTGLGYAVAGQMSSSWRGGNHLQKQALIKRGLAEWKARWPQPQQASALGLVAAIGDPMQIAAAGIALSASQSGGVLLAGGSQMLAVYALCQALAREECIGWQPEQVLVGTTRWVIEDSSADTVAIARQIGAAYLASEITFAQSPYMQLQAYERGFVKEGVGAGGCAIAAHLYKKWTRSQIRHAVEAQLRQSI
ncbi:nicotinate mononucleotide-dependent phosphoribosyltransferase CobT [cf. Phormidesmis sp. LEGE 11477]|uniref:nicotinate mononucleotide-dependent phosphoribosyltransferase CobT n=1 Tax=cf. Phormidesmis sp. LEGE 11477 TaxID=1828680 RepID=UPI00187E44F0|nr:TIGR00303 family protein [cf. Phormidesmis sp. LEGE 11477]MBE9062187.1 TIGR00303 family protein [cf. Phormidesmis sp. LEGE 11477]